MSMKSFVISVVVLVLLYASPSQAKRVYFTPDGSKITVDDGETTSPNTEEPQKRLSFKEKMARDAASAAIMGYKVGQTVKVEKGIIYKLAIDPQTQEYIFKLYRKKARPKAAPVGEAEVSKKDMERMARIDLKEQERKEALASKKKEDERRRLEREHRERMEAEQKALRKAEIEAALKEAERLKLRKMYYKDYEEGRRLQRGDWVVGLEHRYLKWKTVLTKRTETTASGSQNVTEGLNVADAFFTKAHNDLLRIRLMVAKRLELFLEAGMVYETLSDISDMEPAYGGGLRVVLAEGDIWIDSGVYVDFIARYMVGGATWDYTDTAGNDFSTTSDFTEMEAGFKAGIRISNVTIYTGLTYGLFTEETNRVLLSSSVQIFDDELEQQDNLGMMLGLNYRLSPSWKIYAEWHGTFREGGVAGIQYRF